MCGWLYRLEGRMSMVPWFTLGYDLPWYHRLICSSRILLESRRCISRISEYCNVSSTSSDVDSGSSINLVGILRILEFITIIDTAMYCTDKRIRSIKTITCNAVYTYS